MRTVRAFGWLTAILGTWELLAPFIVRYSMAGGGMVDAVLLGCVLLALGLWTAWTRNAATIRALSRIEALLGLWLIVAPFIVGYNGSLRASVNDMIVGAVVLIVSVWGAVGVGIS